MFRRSGWLAGWIAALALAASVPASAQESLEGQIGAGAGFAPDFEGADEYKPIPIVPLSLRYRGVGIQTAGQGLQVDLFPLRMINFGPFVQYRGGRDDVDDPVVDLLPEVDAAVEAGGFVEINLPFFAPGRDAVILFGRVAFDVTGAHDGYLVTPGIRYSVPFGDDWRVNLLASTTIASDNYNGTYFSVGPAGAALSGLPAYDADGGLKDVSGTLSASYLFTEHWGVQGIARYERLLNDAAESPIVRDRGSKHQWLGGLAVIYSF